ncbi:transcriptional regulator [Desulforhopalus sp. IMCC35007]|uniref:helix-turn-helix transcriptional regulator n=1 Tax=Desulforhopalus sp. IMCC35007 TaxID=2569543 RepID=UPI00145E8702|nr:PAS domain-containing protein [Desulforhopalus sp. IMCC35007]
MDKNKLDFLKNVAKGITSVFGERCEVAIHDFKDLKRTLVHVEGDVTNRSLNSSVPDMLYRLIKEFGDDAPDKFGYKSTTEDGKILKCSTHMVRDDEGKLIGCFCINFNVTDFAFLANAFSDFTFTPTKGSNGGGRKKTNGDQSTFAESMESAIDFAVAEFGKIPAMMDKADKIAILEKLDKDGVFMIKGSVDYMARVLGASRYTVYNYLKQIRA